MDALIAPLDFDHDPNVVEAASFSLLTLLETLPELRSDPSVLNNASVQDMAAMYRRGRDNPDHLYLMARVDGRAVGHAIALMRTDADGVRHGYSYTRYVLPAHRRKGVAGALLRAAGRWWIERDAAYVTAHTHATNTGLQALFARAGFRETGRSAGKWDSVALRCERADLDRWVRAL